MVSKYYCKIILKVTDWIGNSLKSILARYRQIKEKGISEEDGTKLNTVTKALAAVGVQAVDSTGQLRNLADVLEELGPIYKRLDETSKAFIATQLFGTYQYIYNL